MSPPSGRFHLARQCAFPSLRPCVSTRLLATISLLLIGYALLSAAALATTHVLHDQYAEWPLSRAMGLTLLAALSALQVAHLSWLHWGLPWHDTLGYRVALFAVAPSFYLFTRPILQPQAPRLSLSALAGHALPLLACVWLPTSIALPLAFVVGVGYLVWLGRGLWPLRAERARFHMEMSLLGLACALAVGVAMLALWPAAGSAKTGQPLESPTFFQLYASAIGLALLLVQITLGRRPHLPADVQEAAREVTPKFGQAPTSDSPASYSSTTLTRVDCDAALIQLDRLMQCEQIYSDPDLSLGRLASQLDLSSHQLSELLNARMGKSFTRLVRERRLAAAKAMLVAEPSASVLSVGLSVGFTSQSSFYEAFREIEGMTPGQYRKLNLSQKQDSHPD